MALAEIHARLGNAAQLHTIIRGGDRRRTILIYALAFLFLAGILLPSRATGG